MTDPNRNGKLVWSFKENDAIEIVHKDQTATLKAVRRDSDNRLVIVIEGPLSFAVKFKNRGDEL